MLHSRAPLAQGLPAEEHLRTSAPKSAAQMQRGKPLWLASRQLNLFSQSEANLSLCGGAAYFL
ncbi:protein of unknown function [Paraburkholderia dioscoreae]|uniref:Uncharacterized protein n=1 Tax=Paraburkholderia dioscoreae TaxID=2604047 RepID=A0A5Q4ZDR0_9BURK|nr:protein of unknown function [Paraburkholderia dioscoreae]